MEFDEEIREFLIESSENLATLDREIVQLEQTSDELVEREETKSQIIPTARGDVASAPEQALTTTGPWQQSQTRSVAGQSAVEIYPYRAAEVSGEGSENALQQDAAKDGDREAQLAESTIRVDVGLLNRLMNLVGELVLARNQLLQDTSAQKTHRSSRPRSG